MKFGTTPPPPPQKKKKKKKEEEEEKGGGRVLTPGICPRALMGSAAFWKQFVVGKLFRWTSNFPTEKSQKKHNLRHPCSHYQVNVLLKGAGQFYEMSAMVTNCVTDPPRCF